MLECERKGVKEQQRLCHGCRPPIRACPRLQHAKANAGSRAFCTARELLALPQIIHSHFARWPASSGAASRALSLFHATTSSLSLSHTLFTTTPTPLPPPTPGDAYNTSCARAKRAETATRRPLKGPSQRCDGFPAFGFLACLRLSASPHLSDPTRTLRHSLHSPVTASTFCDWSLQNPPRTPIPEPPSTLQPS